MKRALAILALVTGVSIAALTAWSAARAGHVEVATLATRVPARTSLMRQRAAEAARHGRRAAMDERWVSYDRISPLLRRAVLIAEDDAFYQHGGLDWNELQASARRNLEEHRVVRGGSTITQQLAKNLFLGTQRTPVRKLEEMFIAVRMERTLSKRRIFELYLNLIEWGDGIYGAEAAAQRWFGVPASDLNARQACLLAAIIINPRRYSAVHPSRRIERRARMIAARMRRRGFLGPEEVAALWGPPASDSTPGRSESSNTPMNSLPEPASGDSAAQP
jgi:monofunctional glycosyltransferase